MNKYNYPGKYGTRAEHRQYNVMNKYNYHGRHGTRTKQQTKNEVVSTTIMESVIPEQNSR